jgi:hypothetical protein
VTSTALLLNVTVLLGERVAVAGCETVGADGAVTSTVHVRVALPLTRSPGDVACTRNVCAASLNPVYETGLVHARNAPPSSEQLITASLLDSVTTKLAERELT